ncbi:MAG: preprotein translocase subunit SecG [Victivallaceae bacterium]|nr:preprotein translocase subunit SecG [Victivallaceae bacterium]
MGVITVVLYTLVIIVALLLIGLVLIQQSKGGGFGGSFGGVGESVFGAHAGGHLTKLTVILTTSFFVLTLLLAVIVGHRNRGRSVAEIDADIAVDAKKAAVEKKVILPESKVKSDKKLKSIEKPEKTKPTTSRK